MEKQIGRNMENNSGVVSKKSTSGITLIALVVTIIVLIILAGISINLILGDNGIITKAQEAKKAQEKAEIIENIRLDIAAKDAEKLQNTNGITVEEIEEILAKYGTINKNEDGTINTLKPTNKDYEILFEDIYKGKINNETEEDEESLAPGLYQTGTTTMLKSWEELKSEGLITVTEKRLDSIDLDMVGDLVVSNEIEDFAGGYYDIYDDGMLEYYMIPCKLTGITIPSSVTSIGDYAFESCSNLTNVIIPDSVTSIGDGAFYECSSLTNIIIPDSVTSIGENAFANCINITSITMPDDATSIGDYAFFSCGSLTSIIIPKGITSIGSMVFDGCNSLTSVTIPDSVISIGLQAFNYCENLTNITIPNSVTSIATGAFSYCNSLTSITIPDSVTSIESCAFSDCSSLKSINVSLNNKVYDSRDNCNAIIRTDSNTLISGCANTMIPSSVTSIGTGAFFGSGLTSIIIPDNIRSLDSQAFSHCSSLSNIIIPDSVTSIGKQCFEYCKSLTSIIIPKDVTIIENGTFCGCSSLTSIEIPKNVTSIGFQAFSSCSSLTNITIPENVTSINGFDDCKNLKSVIIDSSTIAAGITTNSSYGNLINYATTVYLNANIPEESIGSYISSKYKKQATSDKTGYVKYTK